MDHDVIVIGAGIGGLTCAGYLAKAGKRVLVVEKATIPGGGYTGVMTSGLMTFAKIMKDGILN